MDLLRKHYGLSVTPPPPSGRPMDPLDLGQSSSTNILRKFNRTPFRLTSLRLEGVLRPAHYYSIAYNTAEERE